MSGAIDSQPFDLEETFEVLTGHQPFRWQKRLLGCFLDGSRPAALDLPTGLGKTSVMALWLIALGAGAAVPRRLVYVVDRRAVVDQATHVAERLRDHMTPALATALELGERKLPISTLRGGYADNRGWLEDPSRPAIVVGTVDMIGSRLLFGGYGVSRGMRPYQAGFLGVDTLVILDEAHLCRPFEALLRDIAGHRDGKFGPAGREARENVATPPPFHLMSLSATGREPTCGTSISRLEDKVFRLQDEDRDEPVVHRRLTAHKQLKLVEIDEPGTLPDELAQRAITLGDGDVPARVLIYCNSRKDARAAKASIDKAIRSRARGQARAAPDAVPGACELLVGERRVHEREMLADWLAQHGFLDGAETVPEAPVFLVATSAGEVGIDLDADHMVCDLVACERMVQRLGRVNRRGGETRHATVEVVLSPPRLKANANKSARALHERTLKTFKAWRDVRVKLPELWNDVDAPIRAASPQALMNLRQEDKTCVERATTPAPLHPALTRPLVEAWAMTSLRSHEGRTEIAPWLRGWEDEEEPQTSVVWRKHLPIRRISGDIAAPEAARTASFFHCAPIHATEKLEAPGTNVWSWLLVRARQARIGTADQDDPAVHLDDIVALVIDRAGDFAAAASRKDLLSLARPKSKLSPPDKRRQRQWEQRLVGGTLVVDSQLCGLTDGLLDEKSDKAVVTADADAAWKDRKEGLTDRPVIKFRVEAVQADPDTEGLAVPELGEWRHVRTFETDLDSSGRVRGGLAVFHWPDTPTDEESRSILSAPQTLRDHAEQVASRVREMAARIGLPETEVDALECAARYHDDGKAAQRWQNAMNAPMDGRPYAKTCGGGDWRLLEGYRHEFGSLLKAEQAPLPAETRDLILHLIAAHHGNARPLITTAGCEDGPPSVLEARAGEAALRYARLQRRYGIWGLAWREAILRAADQSASRDWSARSRGRSSDG